MKALWAVAYGSLIGFGTAVQGGEYAWQPAAAPVSPAPSGRPVGVHLGHPTPLADAVSLSPPLAADPNVTRTSFALPADPNPRPVFRLQNADTGSRLAPQTTWSRMPSAPASSLTDFAAGSPALPAPTPVPPVPSGPVSSQPLSGFGCGDGACGDSACCGPACCGPTCCDSACCDDPCSCCCPDLACCPCPNGGQHWWTSAEYLLWFIRGTNLPPLLTTTTGSPFATGAGTIGDPNTVILYGGNTITNGPFSGGRFRLGYWFDDCRTCGLDAGFFFLAPRSTNFQYNSSGLPALYRPFYALNPDPAAGIPASTAETLAAPGVSGTATVGTRADLWGAELNYRHNLCCSGPWRLDGLAGFRFLNLAESLTVTEQENISTGILKGPAVGVDSFKTQNQFYGGQLGFVCEYRLNRWVVDLRTTLAIGNTYQSVQVQGGGHLVVNNVPTTVTGYLLTAPVTPGQGGNIGLYSRDRFGFVPEVGITLGYQVTDNLKLFVGYNFLYWANVVRPADQIDPGLNYNLVPTFKAAGSTSAGKLVRPGPIMPFASTNFWAQGVSFGLQYRF